MCINVVKYFNKGLNSILEVLVRTYELSLKKSESVLTGLRKNCPWPLANRFYQIPFVFRGVYTYNMSALLKILNSFFETFKMLYFYAR